VERSKGKPAQADDPLGPASTAERRRLAKIVHDDRGNASVEWRDARGAIERTTLSIEDDSAIRKSGGGFNPYERAGGKDPTRLTPPSAPSARRDLRKLSEWIKQMRELEERKRSGQDDDGAS